MIDLNTLPTPSEKRIAIHVKPAAETALRGGHPWLFDGGIVKQSHAGQPGDLAVIFDRKRRFLAIGLYDPESPIRVKVLQHRQQATIDTAWFHDKLQAAARIRQPLQTAPSTNGYRLVHGENDGLPGLVVDRYADTLVMKLYTAAWLPHLRDVVAGLQQIQAFSRLILRTSRNMQPQAEHFGLHDGIALIDDDQHAADIQHFHENGLQFGADLIHGHKTGFFFDQRDNRAHVRDLAAARDVLDVFAYSGGFSVYAAAGGAKRVTSLDVSKQALEAAVANFDLNGDHEQITAAAHEIIAEDAFDALARLHAEGRRFDMVIVDPPSFAKQAGEVDGALAAYARLTHLALDVLADGGLLVSASCSSRVTRDAFFGTIHRAARDAGYRLDEIMRTGHALDHPITFSEGEYLKCLFATAYRA